MFYVSVIGKMVKDKNVSFDLRNLRLNQFTSVYTLYTHKKEIQWTSRHNIIVINLKNCTKLLCTSEMKIELKNGLLLKFFNSSIKQKWRLSFYSWNNERKGVLFRRSLNSNTYKYSEPQISMTAKSEMEWKKQNFFNVRDTVPSHVSFNNIRVNRYLVFVLSTCAERMCHR